MAEMIPDKLPSKHKDRNITNGEKELFQTLKNLPDDCLVYYEPIIEERVPDFIVISPRIGILVIEVKGWRASDIMGGDDNDIVTSNNDKRVSHKNPMRQARDYMYALMDKCREFPNSKILLSQNKGEHEGKFIFPFGNMIALSNIERHQLQEHKNGDFTAIFPESKTAYKNTLLEFSYLSSEKLESRLKDFFNPWWNFRNLSELQLNLIRSVIHPEIRLTAPDEKEKQVEESASLKVLDLEQERRARNIAEGHRIIYGVAGSGKTVILIARAKLLSQREGNPKILVLCYNVSLSFYLKSVFSEHPNINAIHFDGWASSLGCARNRNESNDELGERLLQRLKGGCRDTAAYKAILIDEAQDFSPDWFRCALNAIEDSENGDLLIAGDGNQKILKGGKKATWKELGIKAQGRTTRLFTNYRNTKKILEVAEIFSDKNKSEMNKDDDASDSTSSFVMNSCKREGDFSPAFIECKTRKEEVDAIVSHIKDLLDKQIWQGSKIPKIEPKDIGILYRHADRNSKPYLNELLNKLRQFTDVIWINEGWSAEHGDSRRRVNEPGVKVQTVHSAKGLQYKVVFVIWADLFPATFDTTDEEQERNLFYVALTRPEEYLMVTSTGSSAFTEELKRK